MAAFPRKTVPPPLSSDLPCACGYNVPGPKLILSSATFLLPLGIVLNRGFVLLASSRGDVQGLPEPLTPSLRPSPWLPPWLCRRRPLPPQAVLLQGLCVVLAEAALLLGGGGFWSPPLSPVLGFRFVTCQQFSRFLIFILGPLPSLFV